MSALFATIVIATTFLGQTSASDPTGGPPVGVGLAAASPASTDQPHTDRELIDQAIADLGDERFIVRKQASQQLWRMGVAAEPALRGAATSRDREVRSRAQRILSDFEFGIVPGVPANIVVWIRQFRDGDPGERESAFVKLLSDQHFDTVERMLRLESDEKVRRVLMARLFSDTNAVERFVTLERVETLIQAVGADQDEHWRRTMMATVLSAPRMLKQLIETGKQLGMNNFVAKPFQPNDLKTAIEAIVGRL